MKNTPKGRREVARVAADPACVPAAAQTGGFAKFAYFRLHGSPPVPFRYADDFLNAMVDRLADLSTRGKVWCIFDNTADGFAIRNALALATQLQKGLG